VAQAELRGAATPAAPRLESAASVFSQDVGHPGGEPHSSRRVNVLGRCYLTGRFSHVDDWPVFRFHRGTMPSFSFSIYRVIARFGQLRTRINRRFGAI
jgi:hypothetical protein